MTATAVAPSDLVRAFVDGPPSPDGPLHFVAGSEGLKRDGRDYRMAGMDLDRYRANPVVLWAHDLTIRPPIGRGLPSIAGDRLLLDVEFDLEDPFAAQVDGKYRRGYLNAVSMLALPTDGTRRGVVKTSELIEVSAVPVPVDASAVAVRRAMAQLGRELLDLAGTTPDEDDDADALRAILGTLDGAAQVHHLRSIAAAITPTRPSIEQRLQTAVRTVLREARP